VDTYDTLKSGVPNAIRVFNEVLKPMGITQCGIRLDSGDIAYFSKKARKMLDEAGWTECKITVSNSLDEYLIRDLLMQGAKIDVYGVGERLITARSEPVFGGVYKLVGIEQEDGSVTPKIKISENVAKITNPGYKRVYRFFEKATGRARADYITLADEEVNIEDHDLIIRDPNATWKEFLIPAGEYEARELLVPIFEGGKQVYQSPPLSEIRDYCTRQVKTLWPEVKRFENPHTYYVDLSDKLLELRNGMLNEKRKHS
jgi:nicotinate phosphoribosyltransferase